jgi:4'-phosphopantetheinyl transferase EntD
MSKPLGVSMPVLEPGVQPSTSLGSLFPPNVVTMETSAEGDPATLSAGEAGHLGRAQPKRAREFAAGRQCARQALERLGLTGWDLAVQPDRSPAWPEEFVGSISHTTGFCGAAVGRRHEFRSIGLDVEVGRRVTPDLYPQFLTLVEQAKITTMSPAMADGLATLIFSAKEAFYKCQYPLTSEWLDFADIEVDLPKDPLGNGCFGLRPVRRLRLESMVPSPWHGQFIFFDEFVATGFVILASGEHQKCR